MDAIVIAGGIPRPEDPLYTYSHGDSKALIDIAGKPMVQWVLDALGNAKQVDNVIVVGLSPKNNLTCNRPLHYLSNQGRMLTNIVTGVHKSLELNKKSKYVLIVSSDIPSLKPEMVDWLVDTCMQTRDDLYYGVCTREVMEKRFPDSKRTYTHLKGMDVCGADMNISHVRMAVEHLEMWEQLIGNRKSPLKQASIIGFGTLFSLFARQLTLEDAVARVSNRIGIKARAIIWPYAEPCMDVDKPHQLELLRADLAKEQRRSVTRAKAGLKKTTKTKAAINSKKKPKVVEKVIVSKAARSKVKPKAKPRLQK
ncbi:MAG: NTP transferase domain-containing protein [Anaerolineae bacterium]|nr:NTP transferase domain-containing protein [Anaerolineae bacterium]MCI0609662.1 NTP transferase domain-containing protein [Anaerolineae bacterium]